MPAPSITVTIRDEPPAGDLFLDDLPAGTETVYVWRVWANREVRIRGDSKTTVVGDQARIEDNDIPVGLAVSYRLQAFDAAGAELDITGHVPSDPETIALDDPQTGWISDPLAPALSLLAQFDGSSDNSRNYNADTTYAQVIGLPDPVAISGSRISAQDWTFLIISPDHDTSTALESLLMGGGTLLLRLDPSMVRHGTGLIYLSAPNVQEVPTRDLTNPGRAEWTITGRQVRAPGLGVVMPIREYQDFVEEALDYATLRDLYGDYLAALRG